MKEKGNLSWGVLETECSQNPVNMQWIAIFVAYVLQTGLFFCVLFFGYPFAQNTPAGENLACLLLPKICILYGNTVVWCIDTLKLRMSPGRHSKIPYKQGFWRHSKFKNLNFGKLLSILSFSVSLYIYIYLCMCLCMYIPTI